MIKYNEFIKTKSIDEAFSHWFRMLVDRMNVKESRDGEVVGEIINATTVIEDITKNICLNNIRKMSMKYAIGELMWYLAGDKSLNGIQNYTSAWDRMSDDGKTVNSNYGWCIQKKYGFDQWEYVKELLKKDSNTRQAILHIKTAEDKESKDVNCTIALQFFIRQGDLLGDEPKLYCTSYMRSNDLWMGFPYDVFQFTCMQIKMAMELGVGFGSYTHIVGSLHLYKRDYDKSILEG